MKIKIHEAYTTKIERALEQANGAHTAHTYTEFEEIEQLADEASSRLGEVGLPLKDWKGALFVARSGRRLPNKYIWPRAVTWVTLERGAKDWFLVGVEIQVTAWGEEGPRTLHLTKAQDEATVAKLRSRYIIRPGD